MKKRFLIYLIVFVFGMFIMPNVYALENVEYVDSWDSLSTCLKASENKICRLSKDILEDADKKNIYISNPSKKVLDLQNFKLNQSHGIYVGDGVELNIISSGNGKMIGSSVVGFMVMAYLGGTINIDNVTLEANLNAGAQAISIAGINNHVTIGKNATIIAGYGVMFQYMGNAEDGANGSVLDVYGTIKGYDDEGGMGITIKGDITGNKHIISDNAPVVNIHSGSNIIGKDAPAIYGAGYGFWNIEGGYIEGTEALSIKSGVFNITGGTLKAVGKYVENPVPQGGSSEETGAAISITSNKAYDGHIKVNISGKPEVISENGNAIYEVVTNDDKSDVEEITITGGEFISSEGRSTVVVSDEFNNNHEKFISGGTFLSGNEKFDVSRYVKNGLIQNQNGEVIDSVESVVPKSNNEVNPDTSDSNIILLFILLILSSLGILYVKKLKIN